MTLQEYVNGVVIALRSNPPTGWPGYETDPVRVWHWIARSFGAGLDIYPDAERIMGELYSRMVVANTFGRRGGVPIDNKTFLGWVREARQEEIEKRGHPGIV